MEGLDVQQLERLLFLFVGLIIVTLIALIAYVVLAGKKRAPKASRRAYREVPLPEDGGTTGQILALVREEPWGPLAVEIGGKRYQSLAEITDPSTRVQVVQAALDLIRLTGAVGADALAPAPLEKTYSWREDLRESSKAELARIQTTSTADGQPQEPPPGEVERKFLGSLAGMSQPPVQPLKPSLADSLQHAMRPRLPEPDQPRSFVDEIEDILQRRIQLISSLQGRGLHIRPGSGGSVRFAFEGQEYSSLDDLPNLTARQLVRDAIQEWDQTT